MSRLTRTFSGNEEMINDPSTSPIIETRRLGHDFSHGNASPLSTACMGNTPLSSSEEQDLFDLICNVNACEPVAEEFDSASASAVNADRSFESPASDVPLYDPAVHQYDTGSYSPFETSVPFPSELVNASSPASSASSYTAWSPIAPSLKSVQERQAEDFETSNEFLLVIPPTDRQFHAQADDGAIYVAPWQMFSMPDSASTVQMFPGIDAGSLMFTPPASYSMNPMALTPPLPSLHAQSTESPIKNKSQDGPGPVRRSSRKTSFAPYKIPQAIEEDDEDFDSMDEATRKKPYSCELCGTRFCRDFERVRHMKSHEGQNLTCGVCLKVIKNGRKDALRRHQLRTKKCVNKQRGLSDDELTHLGCVTSVDRTEWELRVSKDD